MTAYGYKANCQFSRFYAERSSARITARLDTAILLVVSICVVVLRIIVGSAV